MDLIADVDYLIDSENLKNSGFYIGLWYARKHQESIGLDPRDVPMAEHYITELGDGLANGACIILEQTFWKDQGDDSSCERFHAQPHGDNAYYIMDLKPASRLDVVIEKEKLLDRDFDLIAWYQDIVSETAKKDAEIESNSLLESDLEHLSEDSLSDMEISEPEMVDELVVFDSDMDISDSGSDHTATDPEPLEPCPCVPEDDVELEDMELLYPDDIESESPDPAVIDSEIAAEYVASTPKFRIGNILEEQITKLLENAQPYPSDDAIGINDSCRKNPRFDVLRVSSETFTVEDSYFEEITVLPLEYLRIASFCVAEWYAHKRALLSELQTYIVRPRYRVAIGELLTIGVQRYIEYVSKDLPVFRGITVRCILLEPEDLGQPDTFIVRIPGLKYDLFEYITEYDLTNPQFNLANWILRRKVKAWLLDNDQFRGFDSTTDEDYLVSLYNTPDVVDYPELYCGGVQVPADGYKGITRTASMPRVPDRIVAKPLVIVALVNGQPVRALIRAPWET
ncbi:hypothetical protein B0H13DRAFT_2383345 [Mycena leptocephala]|nr:hypothetical protein B0H13DRAFT_2383345 [Mycena leptocephala]